jgi:hypothetical protein
MWKKFYWVHFLAIKLFNNKYYRRIRLFVVILYSSVVCAHIYFCITLFDTAFLFQYVIGSFGLIAVSAIFLPVILLHHLFLSVFFNASFFVTEIAFTTLENTIYLFFWSPSSTTKNVQECITRDCKYRSTRTAWRVTQCTEIPPTSGAHLSVGSGNV